MEDQTMKKNFKLYALLLTLGLGATRISFAPEEHLPEHAPAHEPERAPRETPEEIQKRHEREQEDLQTIHEQDRKKLDDNLEKLKKATSKTTGKIKKGETNHGKAEVANNNLKSLDITIDNPHSETAKEDAEKQLKTKHDSEQADLNARHKAEAAKATDELGDVFKELSEKPTTEEPKAKAKAEAEAEAKAEPTAKDNERTDDESRTEEEANETTTENLTEKEKATETANKKETIESTALVIKEILFSADDFNKNAGFDVIDPNEIKDLNKNLNDAKKATSKKYNSIMDYIDAILSDLMRILKNLKSSMGDSLQERLDKLSAKLDIMKEKRAKEQEQKDKSAKDRTPSTI